MTSDWSVVLAAAALTAVVFTACWLYGLTHGQDFSVTDTYYGLGLMSQGWLAFALWHEHTGRAAVLLVLATAYSIGLGQMLARRWVKNHAQGGDERYVMAVEKFKPGKNLWWMTYLTLVVGQTVFVTVLDLPLILAVASDVEGIAGLDVLGYALIAVGAAIEIAANHHLELFKRDSANKGKTLMTGLWSWSRHPNYFGNVLVYVGCWVVAMRRPDLWWTVISPLAIYGLLRYGSGVRLTEWMMLQKRKGDPVYQEYLRRTSPFFPRPPRPATRVAEPAPAGEPARAVD
jgi:steroid 5-alpha reductase family enzyme